MKYKCIKEFTIKQIGSNGAAKITVSGTHVEKGSVWKLSSCGGGKVILQRCNDGMVKLEIPLDTLKKCFELL